MRAPFRRGLTLVELLITIAILAILAALVLGAANSATEAARRARTKVLISKIHALIIEQYESYETRRVDLRRDIELALNDPSLTNDPRVRGAMRADLRLLALRELVKYEMPDRWSDVTMVEAPAADPDQAPLFLAARPTLAELYLRRYRNLNPSGDIAANQGAECLYLTVMFATGDGEARTHFSEQDVGDTDGDGAPEFIDAWGNPIHWVRWPAGFAGESPLITGVLPDGTPEADYDPVADHDPLDPFRRDSAAPSIPPNQYSSWPINRSFIVPLRMGHVAFRLIPLIYSAGPDGVADLITSREDVVTQSPSFLDPYYTDPGNGLVVAGRPLAASEGGGGWIDNIHNHEMDNQ